MSKPSTFRWLAGSTNRVRCIESLVASGFTRTEALGATTGRFTLQMSKVKQEDFKREAMTRGIPNTAYSFDSQS